MIKILIIGPGSLTGSRFVELGKSKFEMYGAGGSIDEGFRNLVDFQELDITDENRVLDIVKNFPGEFIINFAGATLVDEIEKTRPKDSNNKEEFENNLAYRVNVIGTRHLARACMEFRKFPVFISTGFVFDGKSGPYTEDDELASSPDDVSWYAWTKILAEKEVEESGVENITLRICYPYRNEYSNKSDFARSMLKAYDEFKAGKRSSVYPMFSDQTLTPTFIDDISGATLFLIEHGGAGIYHLTSPDVTTPYDFCLELLRVARGDEHPEQIIQKGSIVEFQKSHLELAKRPVHGGEKSDKIKSMGFTPTAWKEGIRKAYGK